MSSRLDPIPATAPLTDVRSNLSEIVDEIDRTGTQCVITKHGRPVAVIVSSDEYESLIETLNILGDSDTMTAIAQGEAEFAAGEFVRLDEI
ncbi:type II toxin-antitoxin system Phd/YefM family antitoxin [Candidatus Poriferisodalis sp.]|uniref:type II toxin-antitoxin system Phd/YefM family antitoxin n=1 Tax=Candidatus Poriferisodalis sp. TaxID=3101277 RepID=UPI003B02E9BC